LQDDLESLVLRMQRGGIRYSEGLREFQKIFVLTVLREQKWNQLRAAETLDVHRDTLRRLIQQFQLNIKSLRAAGRRRPPESEPPLPLEKKARAT
jgi:transcriptional regulator with GAF, ATPase, and Fis domain